MARIRTIKPEFFTSEDIVSRSPVARLFYIALWCEADRCGRMEWKPGTFKLRYLPGDNVSVDEVAKELVDAGLLVIYEVSGKRYAEIPTFEKHQVINNREAESALPTRADASSTRAPRVKAASSPVKAEGKEGKGKEGTEHASEDAVSFERYWQEVPNKVAKSDAEKAFKKLDPSPELFDSMLKALKAQKLWPKWLDKGGQFIPMPATWLNGRRWEDEPPPIGLSVVGGNGPITVPSTAADRTLAELDADKRTPEQIEAGKAMARAIREKFA